MTTSTPSGSRRVTVYEATRSGLPPLRRYFYDLRRHWPYIWHVARSDLKADNYASFMGQVWLILNPLLLAAVWLFVRAVIRPLGTPETRNDLITHLIAGIYFYQYMTGILNASARSIIKYSRMVLNTTVPRLAYPLTAALRDMLEFVPTLGVYFLIHVALGQPWGWSMLWLPPLFVLMTMFSFGTGLFFAAISVRYQDTLNLLRFILRLTMFMSPILFTLDEIPAKALPYLRLNPFFGFFAALEQIFDGIRPDYTYLLGALGWTLLALAVGGFTFLRKERTFAAQL